MLSAGKAYFVGLVDCIQFDQSYTVVRCFQCVMLSGTKCSRNIPGNGHLVSIGSALRYTVYFPQGPFPGDPSTLLRMTYSDSRSHIIQSALRNCVVCFSNAYCSKSFAHFAHEPAETVLDGEPTETGFAGYCSSFFTKLRRRLC